MQLTEKIGLTSMDTFYTGRGIDEYLSNYHVSTQELKSNFTNFYSRSAKTNYNSQSDLSKYHNKYKNCSSKGLDIKIDMNYIKYKHNEQKENTKYKNEEGVQYKCACQSKSYKTLLKAYRKNKDKFHQKQQNKKTIVSTACQASAPEQVKVIEKTIVKEVPIHMPTRPIISTSIPYKRQNSFCCNSAPKYCCVNQYKNSPKKINFNYSNQLSQVKQMQVIVKNSPSTLMKAQQQKNVSVLPQTHQHISHKSSRMSESRKKILKQRNSHRKGIEVVQKKKVTIESRIQNSSNLEPSSARKSLYRSSSKSITSHDSLVK